MILKAFGFEENAATQKLELKEFDEDLFKKGIELLNMELM